MKWKKDHKLPNTKPSPTNPNMLASNPAAAAAAMIGAHNAHYATTPMSSAAHAMYTPTVADLKFAAGMPHTGPPPPHMSAHGI